MRQSNVPDVSQIVNHMDFQQRRADMVVRDIAHRGVRSAQVLAAMRSVPRESFLPPDLWEFAYEDAPLPIAEGQTISQPYIVAMMTEPEYSAALRLKQKYGGEQTFQEASAIVHEYFSDMEALGTLRLREHPSTLADRDSIREFLAVLAEIFSASPVCVDALGVVYDTDGVSIAEP